MNRFMLRCGVALLVAACSQSTVPEPDPEPMPIDVTGRVPLPELGINRYKGSAGGLYDDGTNEPPAAHRDAGIAIRNTIRPLDSLGTTVAGNRRILLLSIGMSNTTQEFCSGSSTATACTTNSFMGLAAADAQVNHTSLTILNGARGSQVASEWDDPSDQQYDTVRYNRLARNGLTEAQVQVAWLKIANPTPSDSMPGTSDALTLEAAAGRVVRALKIRYPNLKMVFVSSRIYGGYATTNLNPEPFAYESGFSVKWLISAQARQVATGVVDPVAGDLDYRNGHAPWLAWGPYLWADGATPRKGDGLSWVASDFSPDGTHPGNPGIQKVATQLIAFFKTSDFTACWFTASGVCP